VIDARSRASAQARAAIRRGADAAEESPGAIRARGSPTGFGRRVRPPTKATGARSTSTSNSAPLGDSLGAHGHAPLHPPRLACSLRAARAEDCRAGADRGATARARRKMRDEMVCREREGIVWKTSCRAKATRRRSSRRRIFIAAAQLEAGAAARLSDRATAACCGAVVVKSPLERQHAKTASPRHARPTASSSSSLLDGSRSCGA